MSFTPDGQGNIDTTIDIPDDLLVAGIHEIEFETSNGEKLLAYYANKPNLSLEEKRQIASTAGTDEFVSVAQTVSLDTARDITGVRLDINTNGDTGDFIVQLRGVENGEPNQTVYSEARKTAASINPYGTFDEFVFDPVVPALPNKEYAICLLTPNINSTVAVATLGGTDVDTGNIIASQPATGVLYTSSNGKAYTVEQNKDLKYQLLVANYTSTTKVVDLGTKNVSNVTDLMLLSDVELPDKDTSITYQITTPNEVVTVDRDKPILLNGSESGDFTVQATLTGTSTKSPVLFPNTLLALGTVETSNEYNSRKFKVPDSYTAKLVIEVFTVNSGASVQPRIEDTSEANYENMSLASAETLEDGWVKQTWEYVGATEVGTSNLASIQLALTGTVNSRVYVRDLRAWAE